MNQSKMKLPRWREKLLQSKAIGHFPVSCDKIYVGARVRTTTLGDTKGLLIHTQHLRVRLPGVTGKVLGMVAGHGGDVWYVRHDSPLSAVGAYVYSELKVINHHPH